MRGASVQRDGERAVGWRVSVKKQLANPPKALRRHDGRNDDLRRWVIESDPGVVDSVTDTLRAVLAEHLQTALVMHRELVTFTGLPRDAALLVCDYVITEAVDDGDNSVTLAVGCVAGQHRSVSIVEHIVRSRALLGLPSCVPYAVVAVHRELGGGASKKTRERSALRRVNKRSQGRSRLAAASDED